MTAANSDNSSASLTPARHASSQSYPADLYQPDGLAHVYDSVAAIDAAAVASYHQEGYLAVADLYSSRQVQNAMDALSQIIAGRHLEFNNFNLENFEELKDKSKDDPIFGDPLKMEALVRKVGRFSHLDARLKDMVEHPPLVDLIEKLAGEKMVLTQEMALLKPPGGREKPWHQDHAYFNIDNARRVVGAWIALDPATLANGCMCIMPGRHHEPIIHFNRRDWQICDTTTLQIKDRCLAVPLEPGGVLFFDSFLPHGTPTNHTNQRRRALQFHFKPATAKDITSEARMEIWGSEGKDVEC